MGYSYSSSQTIDPASRESRITGIIGAAQYNITEDGKAAVVRNGYHPERDIQTGIGPVTVKIPKVRNRAGDPVVFHSALVLPYIRKTPTLEAVVPWLYLKGVSTGEMGDTLRVLVGKDAAGLSVSTVSRLKKVWSEEYHAWRKQDQSKDKCPILRSVRPQ